MLKVIFFCYLYDRFNNVRKAAATPTALFGRVKHAPWHDKLPAILSQKIKDNPLNFFAA